MDGDAPMVAAAEEEPHVERLPADLLAQVLTLLPTFHDLAMAGGVSRRWRRAVGQSLATRRRLSFAGQRTGDDSTARLVRAAVNLRDLDICASLKSIILWSCRHVTEAGLVALVNKCPELECINVGGMRVSPESFAGLLSISPALRIRSIPQILNADVQVS